MKILLKDKPVVSEGESGSGTPLQAKRAGRRQEQGESASHASSSAETISESVDGAEVPPPRARPAPNPSNAMSVGNLLG